MSRKVLVITTRTGIPDCEDRTSCRGLGTGHRRNRELLSVLSHYNSFEDLCWQPHLFKHFLNLRCIVKIFIQSFYMIVMMNMPSPPPLRPFNEWLMRYLMCEISSADITAPLS